MKSKSIRIWFGKENKLWQAYEIASCHCCTCNYSEYLLFADADWNGFCKQLKRYLEK